MSKLLPTKFTLRKDQAELKGELHEKLFWTNKIVFCAATGYGKSVLLADFVRDYVTLNSKVLILVHRNQLILQLSKTLDDSGIPHNFIKAGHPEDRDKLVHLASVQTLNRRLDYTELDYDLVILDECHLTSYTRCAQEIFKLDKASIVGFTATPWSLSKKKQLANLYEDIIVSATPKELMKRGVLARDKYFANFTIDTTGVKIVNGDYKADELSVVCNHPSVILKASMDWGRFGQDRPTACFCVDVKHAMKQCNLFNNENIPAKIITGETPQDIRDRTLEELDRGIIKIICSIGVLTEGWDYKKLGCILMCRPTKSKSLYTQIIGRGLRSHPDKNDCIIIDLTDNVSRFGLINEYQKEDYSLEYIKPRKGDAPIRKCPMCDRLQHPAHSSCVNCGHLFEVKEKKPIMAELVPDTDRYRVMYRQLLKESYLNQYSPTYAYIKLKQNYHVDPVGTWGEHAIFEDTKVTRSSLDSFADWIYSYCAKYRKPYWYFKMFFVNEFGKSVNENIVKQLWETYQKS